MPSRCGVEPPRQSPRARGGHGVIQRVARCALAESKAIEAAHPMPPRRWEQVVRRDGRLKDREIEGHERAMSGEAIVRAVKAACTGESCASSQIRRGSPTRSPRMPRRGTSGIIIGAANVVLSSGSGPPWP